MWSLGAEEDGDACTCLQKLDDPIQDESHCQRGDIA